MTATEEVIRLAREAGLHVITNGDCEVEDIARLIKLVKAEENEACAKVCDAVATAAQTFGYKSQAGIIGKRIRARRK